MKKFYLIPIDLDLETGIYSDLTTEQIKDIIDEYCDNGDIFIIDAIPYNEAPTPERFTAMLNLAEELYADDAIRLFIDIHVSLNGIDYNKLKDFGYELLCTERVRDDLCLDKRDVMFIDDIISATQEQKDEE